MIILPGVMILMGLFSVWVSKQTVVNYLGRGSGLKGIGLSILFGTLPTGPLYIAFPIALSLFKKGARVMNVVVFLSAWACIKLPQEMVEIQFMGLKFAGIRIALTIPLVALMGWIMEQAEINTTTFITLAPFLNRDNAMGNAMYNGPVGRVPNRMERPIPFSPDPLPR